MWSIECVCSSIQNVIVASFFSYWHHAIGSKGAPRGFNSIGVYWSMLNSEHLGLFRSYLPHLNSKSCTVSFVEFPNH